MIHPTAIVEEGAVLGEACVLHAHAVVRRGSVLGNRVVVHSGAVVGGEPQDLRFDPATPSGVRIGAGTVLREHVTVNRSTKPGGETRIGEECYLMAGAHVAHDGVIGNKVILANQVMLAGHVQVGDFTFVGGGAGVHQFARIGESVMLGGLSRISLDLPPFLLVAERDEVSGLNLVGLRRRGIGRDAVRELKEAFRSVYLPGGNPRLLAAAALAAGGFKSEEAKRFLAFFSGGKRGVARPAASHATGPREPEEKDGEEPAL